MSQRSITIPSALRSLPLLHLLFGAGLCMVHAHAEKVDSSIGGEDGHSMDAWDRITSGPFHWSAMDKVLFFALIMLALELLNFLCNHSGGKEKSVVVAKNTLARILIYLERKVRHSLIGTLSFHALAYRLDECKTHSSPRKAS